MIDDDTSPSLTTSMHLFPWRGILWCWDYHPTACNSYIQSNAHSSASKAYPAHRQQHLACQQLMLSRDHLCFISSGQLSLMPPWLCQLGYMWALWELSLNIFQLKQKNINGNTTLVKQVLKTTLQVVFSTRNCHYQDCFDICDCKQACAGACRIKTCELLSPFPLHQL